MREIKFRAWDCIAKKIIEVKEMKFYGPGYTTSDIGINSDGQCDYPLMQYTGLKDKNGVEIYEGDIVKINDYAFEVRFGNLTAWDDWGENNIGEGLGLYSIDSHRSGEGNHECNFEFNETKVIGNIYEGRSIPDYDEIVTFTKDLKNRRGSYGVYRTEYVG